MTTAQLLGTYLIHTATTMLYTGFKAVIVLAVGALAAPQGSNPLPKVDLGYEIHQASSFNVRSYLPKKTNWVADNDVGHWRILQFFQYQICRATCWEPSFPRTGSSTEQERYRADGRRRENLPSSFTSMAFACQQIHPSIPVRSILRLQCSHCRAVQVLRVIASCGPENNRGLSLPRCRRTKEDLRPG